MIYLIGCGGVGSWIAPVITRLRDPKSITMVDGDTLEKKNLDRQFFDAMDIGKNKATALAAKYGTEHIPSYYSLTLIQHDERDVLISCVDNHPARNAVLKACDMGGCQAILAGNETFSAEAMYYNPMWQGTSLDPRIYYPEIETDNSGDPRRVAIGCTGEIQKTNPQLATANFMAAGLALNLFVVWFMEYRKFEKDAIPHLPHKLSSTLTRLESFKAQLKGHTDDTQ